MTRPPVTWIGRIVLGLALGAGSPAFSAEATAPKADANPAAKGKKKGPAGGLWESTLMHAPGFANRGIETFSHGVITSRKLNFKGASETAVGYTIYLPPQYAAGTERFPVLYFLHGLGGNENTVTPVVTKAHELIAQGELPPFIVVSAAAGRSFYGDQFEGRFQVHTFYTEELVPHIDRTYRTKAEPRFRHIQGFSMGGYGALVYAIKHPELFGAVTDLGGALGAARNHGWKEMYDAKEENYAPFDLHRLTATHAERLKRLPLAIWIGSEDIVKQANVQYHAMLQEKGIPHAYHDWNSDPKLLGVPHNLPRYFELYGKEILEFHTKLW